MVDTIKEFMAYYNALLKDNPSLAIIILPVIGYMGYAVRSIPGKIWDALKGGLCTNLEINNAGFSGDDEQFDCFMRWFSQSRWFKFSRSIYAGARFAGYDSSYKRTGYNTILGPGNGWHFFFHNRRLYWFHKSDLESSGSEKLKSRLKIYTFGKTNLKIQEFIKEFEPKVEKEKLYIYQWRKDEWAKIRSIEPRKLDCLVMEESLRSKITKHLDHYVTSKDWYSSRGLAYKITTLLKGPPGTGKTSLVKAIASHYERSIYIVDLSSVVDQALMTALHSVPAGSVVLMEDVDAATRAVSTRQKPKTGSPSDGKLSEAPSPTPIASDAGFLTLSGILNALDGIVPLDDLMVFMTTNHADRLDPALTRKSRVDLTYEIGYMTSDLVVEYGARSYGEEFRQALQDYEFPDLPACDAQAAFKENPQLWGGYVKALGGLPKSMQLTQVEPVTVLGDGTVVMVTGVVDDQGRRQEIQLNAYPSSNHQVRETWVEARTPVALKKAA